MQDAKSLHSFVERDLISNLPLTSGGEGRAQRSGRVGHLENKEESN